MTQAAPEIYTETITPIQGGDSVSFRMIKVEGGEFWMGSEDEEALNREKPVHRVELSTFWMGEFLVTQGLWQAIFADNPSYFPGMDRPVENVSWMNIKKQFLPVLNQSAKQVYRLPTEAEWEYAARGGGYQTDFLYSGSSRLQDVGWYKENSHQETKTVGLKQPNTLGLYDMNGNVWEWCADWYDEKYYQACADEGIMKNPTGPPKGRNRLLRGGSWSYHSRFCRVSHRYFDIPIYADYFRGFRLVASTL